MTHHVTLAAFPQVYCQCGSALLYVGTAIGRRAALGERIAAECLECHAAYLVIPQRLEAVRVREPKAAA